MCDKNPYTDINSYHDRMAEMHGVSPNKYTARLSLNELNLIRLAMLHFLDTMHKTGEVPKLPPEAKQWAVSWMGSKRLMTNSMVSALTDLTRLAGKEGA